MDSKLVLLLVAAVGLSFTLSGCVSGRSGGGGGDDDDATGDDDDATEEAPPYEFTPILSGSVVFDYRSEATGDSVCVIDHFGSDRSDEEPPGAAFVGATEYFAVQYTLDPDSSCFELGVDYQEWIASNATTFLGALALVPSSATDGTLYEYGGETWQPLATGARLGTGFEAEDFASAQDGVEMWVVWSLDW